jgi:UDP-glucose 4-epimerase
MANAKDAERTQGPQAPLPSEDVARVAVTGASRFLGEALVKRLAQTPSVREIHVFDIRMPEVPSSKIVFHRVDLTRDNADAEIAAILKEHDVRVFVHAALFSGPQRELARAREVECIGTFHVLNAVAEAGVSRLLVLSDTFVYGALPSNPNFLVESTPLRNVGPQFVRARVDVEKQVQEFASEYPSCATCVLRFAPVLGPTSSNVRARYFLVGLVPKVLGYDPLLQFIHEDDALRAALMALFNTSRGAYNIVGGGVLSLSTGIHMAGRIPLPVAGFVCRTVFSIGYGLRVWDLPPGLVPFYQFLCVADGKKADRVFGFRARYSSRQALKAMIEAHRLRSVGFSVPTQLLGEDEPVARARGFERVV